MIYIIFTEGHIYIYAGDIHHPRGDRLPCIACCLSSPSLMWKHVYKVSYYSLSLTDDGVTLKQLVSQSLLRVQHQRFFSSGWRLPDSTGVQTQFSEGLFYHQGKILDWVVEPYRAWKVSLQLFPVVGWCWSQYIATVMTVGSLGCTILLVCVFWGSRVIRSLP